MRISLFLASLSLLFISIDATIPNVDFTALLQKYATTTDGTWCSQCKAFGQPLCAMGCAGDGGGGGPCPNDACPRLFTFPIVNSQPIWNIQVATAGDPYRAFSYIPLCTQPGECTESFIFSFSYKYTPGANAAQSNFFSQQRDYLKLLFWGDGNNILGVKNGRLLGLPNGGGGDLVGSNNIGTGEAFSIPFLRDTWTHVGVQFNVQNGRTSLAFYINGIATGLTTGSVGVSNTGLQFGAYVWNGAKFTLQYKDIAITKNLPSVTNGGGITPVTAKPTTSTVTQPPLDDTTNPPISTDPSAVTTRQPSSPPTVRPRPNMPIYTTVTVALHNIATDCWTILDGIVYDITNLIQIHPGGIVIRSYCGRDCSSIFSSSHENDAADRTILAKAYLQGSVGTTSAATPGPVPVPSNPTDDPNANPDPNPNPNAGTNININSKYNHATTITSTLLCIITSCCVALVLEYFL